MRTETLRRIAGAVAIIVVLILGFLGVRQVMAGPADRDLGNGFVIDENRASPTSEVPQSPTPSTTPSPTATPSQSPKPSAKPSQTSTPTPAPVEKTSKPRPTQTVAPKPTKKPVVPLPPSANYSDDDDDDDFEDDDDDDD